MGIGVSIFLLALGAILAFAIDVQTSGIDLNTVGVILMVVGAIGLATSFMFWDRMGFGAAGRRTVSRTSVVDDGVAVAPRATAVRERTVVRDDQVL
jgi:type IV secretory pathway VirB3-like protein